MCDDEVVVFSTFLDAGIRIPSVPLMIEVPGIYQGGTCPANAQLHRRLSIFEWAMRSLGADGSGRLFAFLHDVRCQPNKKKGTKVMFNYGSVNFQVKPSWQQYMLFLTSKNQWETDWVKKWFTIPLLLWRSFTRRTI